MRATCCGNGSVVKPDNFSQRWLVGFQIIPVLPALIKNPLIGW